MGNKINKYHYVTHKREPFFDIAKKYISSDKKVLDVGAGDGYFAEYCQRPDFFLFEGNEDNFKNLSKKYCNSYYGKLPGLPFQDLFFDVIHCSHVVEHLYPSEFYDTLKEMDRCLKKNGYLIISAPLFWENFFADLSHIKPYHPDVFLKYLSSHTKNTLSTEKISEKYELVEIQYRYKEVSLKNGLHNLNKNIFISLILKALGVLHKLGLRKMEKTGFTLVLLKK